MLAYYIVLLNPDIIRFNDRFAVRWYGLAYVLAFVCGYLLYKWLARRGYSDLKESQVGDFISGAAIFGVMLGGRLGYFIFYHPEAWIEKPIQILQVWDGGMASHGGMIGLVLYTLWFSRRYKVSWTNIGDNLCVVAPIGLFFGRLANFINGELYGRPSTVPWAMKFPRAEFGKEQVETMIHEPDLADKVSDLMTPRHPSQIYEALLEGLALFSILWIVRTRFKTPNGVLTGLFFLLYGIFRIFVEQFREPDEGIALLGVLTRGQVLSFGLLVAGLAFLFAAYTRPGKKTLKAS